MNGAWSFFMGKNASEGKFMLNCLVVYLKHFGYQTLKQDYGFGLFVLLYY